MMLNQEYWNRVQSNIKTAPSKEELLRTILTQLEEIAELKYQLREKNRFNNSLKYALCIISIWGFIIFAICCL